MKRIIVLVLLGVLCYPGDAMAERTKWSWYGGPTDSGDNNRPASGIPNTIPGIARYNQRTLKGYFVVDDGKNKWLLQQTDIGPSPSTGRGVDINASAVGLFGHTTSSFPTDKTVNVHYLGQNLAQARRRAVAMGAKVPGYKHYGGAAGGVASQMPGKAAVSPSNGTSDYWRAFHQSIARGGVRPLESGIRYGDLSPQGQALWTPEYKAFFAQHGGEQGFRQRESLRGLGRKTPDFHDQLHPNAAPREPTAAFDPTAPAATGPAPHPIDQGVHPPATESGIADILKKYKIPGV